MTDITVGVDLSAEPAKTATATLRWSTAGAELVDVRVGATDDDILAAVTSTDGFVGIDCPFGWPDAFVEFIRLQASLAMPPDYFPSRSLPGAAATWRRRLAYRHTDEFVRSRTGRPALSVSTDKLGLVAMRGTSLLASLAHLGVPVSRSGEGRVLEVYPGASLRVWNLPVRGYKTDAAVRSELLSTIQAQAPWLDLGPWGELCVAVDHALDALISALTARAGAKGAFVPPPVELHEVASREGWIVLPTKALADLL